MISEESRLEELTGAWDALAVTNSAPESGPAWMLAWWRHVAPPGAELRVVAVSDRGELIGIAPLYLDRGHSQSSRRYRLLASDFSASVTPLALPDRTWDVAKAVTDTLATAEPRPSALELAPTPATSPWMLAMRECWPARIRPVVHRAEIKEVPTVPLREQSFEAWLQGRNSRFRNNFRRYRRRFGEEGGTERLSTPETFTKDIETFVRLHTARWEGHGTSRLVALGERLPAFFEELARASPAGRFRLLMLELEGKPICANPAIAAGGEIVAVNLGWDERFKYLSAPRLSALSMIAEGFRQGDHRLNFGWGRVDYKRDFANGDDPVVWDVLLPVGARLPLELARAAPTAARMRVARSAKRILPTDKVESLRALRQHISRT